ncbi:MAG TPA: ABC transporter permease [Gemmatimonadaceae bacterium]|nr:ABC transporter permease [Gemmatimonadaceae bacterium]
MTSIAELEQSITPPSEPIPPGPVKTTLVIQPSGVWPRLNLGELWTHRGILAFLIWRDVKVRYAHTILGAGWAIFQPVMTMLVFTVIFGRFAKIPSDGVPYPVFALASLVPWMYFASATTGAANSLLSNPELISKIYVPRLIIPLTPVLSGLVEFAIGLVLLLLLALWFGNAPTPESLLLLPFALAVTLMTAIGVGCWLSALNIQYRDVKHITPFLMQLWMYGSPVVYPLSIVPEHIRPFYVLNPMAGAIEGFRSALLGTGSLSLSTAVPAFVVSALLAITGAIYFRRTERVFADVS